MLDPCLMEWARNHPQRLQDLHLQQAILFSTAFRASLRHLSAEVGPQAFAGYGLACVAAGAITADVHPNGRHGHVMADLLGAWLESASLFCSWFRWSATKAATKGDLLIGLPLDLPGQHALILVRK